MVRTKKQLDKMGVYFSWIAKNTIGKWLFGLTFSMETLNVLQTSDPTLEGFYKGVLNNLPAKLVYIVSIAYIVIKLLVFLVNSVEELRKKIKMNNIEISKQLEELERSEIDTDIKKKDLNDH